MPEHSPSAAAPRPPDRPAVSDGRARGAGASKAELAYAELTRRLVLLDIPPGAPLLEQELMADLGVGRTPLREAIQRLRLDRLVVTYPRRGTFASPVDVAALAEVAEVRRALEPMAARLAAERRTEADVEELTRTQEQLRTLPSAPSIRDLMEHDLRAHRTVHRAAGNRHLARTLERYGNIATRAWSVGLTHLPDAAAHVIELNPLLQAVIDSDADEASRLMLAHMDEFSGWLNNAT